jgi:hypothetical protein
MSNGTKSTRKQLKQVADVNRLYRHQHNGAYYAVKKLHGKRKEHKAKISPIGEKKVG